MFEDDGNDRESAFSEPGFSQVTTAMVVYGARIQPPPGLSWNQVRELVDACAELGLVAAPGGDLSPETGSPGGPDAGTFEGGVAFGALVALAEANPDHAGGPGERTYFTSSDVARAKDAWTAKATRAIARTAAVVPGCVVDEGGVVLVPAGPLAAAWLFAGEGGEIVEDGESHEAFQTSTDGNGIVFVQLEGEQFSVAAQYD